eukprot:m51a1_g6469 Adaptor protein complex 1 (AP-1), sigma subunit A (162) ;mRNA; r:63086-64468
MTVHFMLSLNKQCKIRLSKWYSSYTTRERDRIVREVGYAITQRSSSMCNFVEWRDCNLVYKRYASLYFLICVDRTDNELISLELVHRFVFVLDKYFGNVTELDLIYDFSRAYIVLDELLIAGEQQETSAAEILRTVDAQDDIHKAELIELANRAASQAPKR